MPTDRHYPRSLSSDKTVPFASAEEAWLWFILAQEARSDGARVTAGLSLTPRPCEPGDILTCVERLYRNRRLTMDHLLVLRHYGKRQMPPDAGRIKEARAFSLWEEALGRLESVLISKGIVEEPDFLATQTRNWAAKAVIHHGGFSL